MPLTVEPQQWQQMNAKLKSKICPLTYVQYFTHSNCYRRWYLSSKCLLYPHQQVGEMKSLCKVDSTCAQWWPKRHASFSHHHPSVTLEKWMQCIPWSNMNNDKSRMCSFDPQLKWQNAEWRALKSLRKKIASCSQGALRVMHVRFISWKGIVLNHPMPVGTMVSGRYYCSVFQDMVMPTQCCKQLELLEHGVILLQDIATPNHHHDAQNLVQCCGRQMLGHPPCSPDLAPCDYWHVWKNFCGEKDFNW